MESIVKKRENLEKKDEEYSPIDLSLIERKKVIGQYKKLRALHKLQKEIVRKNMHNAMSPISAISGYLELMNMTLDNDADIERIERYRKKIKSGVSELNAIIEQLHERFSKEEEISSDPRIPSEEINNFIHLE